MKGFVVLLVIVASSGAVGRSAPADVAPPPAALADFFKPGVVWQDRNGDGAVDFVDARIVLPEQPTSGELAAAADVAARLGFETSAMDLPMVRLKPDLTKTQSDTPHATGASIFIGSKSLAQAGVSLDAIGAAGLKAGEGLVTAFSLAGRPAVAVLGGDEVGLSVSAVMLAGHLPFVWDQKSVTMDKIAGDAKEFLSGKGVNAASSVAHSIFVRD